METDSPSIRTLHRAMDMVGSRAKLARALDCSVDELQSWLDGAETPTRAFIAALAIVAKGRQKAA
jgi:DNA-binding transcriptional regulator YiaG